MISIDRVRKGEMLAGRYRLEEIVGAGEVWRATDLERRRVVAVKRVRAGDKERVRREARIGAHLQHPNVVVVFDVVRERSERWLVMEYLPSRSLTDVLLTGDLVSPGRAAEIGAQVATALASMHEKGLVHHDVTPENILVTEDGTAKLADLGIVKWTGITDDEASGPEADIHALGTTLVAITEGGTTFPELLASFTDPDPRNRPTAAEARALLLEIAANPPVDADAPEIVPRMLPPAPVPFEGRERELRSITGEVVVLSAIGGMGKTWLALRWAHDNLKRFPDGQLFADLRGFDPAGQPPLPTETVLHGFLSALGVPPGELPVDRTAQANLYRSLVSGRRMLILLDNAHDAGQIADLLPGTPSCTVLITSRDRIRGLAAAQSPALNALTEDEARALLTRRLGEEEVDAKPEAVDEILSQCAGLPLALAIAAARMAANPKLSLRTTAAELRSIESGIDELDPGNPAARLEVVLEVCSRWLMERHQDIFGLLGLAPGPDITLAAAANLIDGPIAEARTALRALARHSLVDEHLPGRWRMHDLVRLHAVKDAGWRHSPEERRDALRRLVHFFLHTAHRAAALLDPARQPVDLGSPPSGCAPQRPADSAAALDWFEAEHPGLLAVQRLAVEHAWDEQVWQFASALSTFHSARGRVHDELAVWRLALSAAERLDDPAARALSHRCLGDVHVKIDDLDKALEHLRVALSLYEASEDVRGQGLSYRILGRLWERRGDDELASEYSALARERLDES